MTTAHAFGDDVLQNHDGVALAALIRDKEVRPDEVVAAAAARARRVKPSINAVVVEDYDAAVERSRAHVAGAFGGVPTFIKDQDDVVGLPTRYGSEALENVRPATHTSEPIAQMFDMGMVCLGTSSLPEFGFVPSTEFPNSEATRNPWNPKHTAGGVVRRIGGSGRRRGGADRPRRRRWWVDPSTGGVLRTRWSQAPPRPSGQGR